MVERVDSLRRLMTCMVRYNVSVQTTNEENQLVELSVKGSDTVQDLRIKLVKVGVVSWKHSFMLDRRKLGEHEQFRHSGIRNGKVLVMVREVEDQLDKTPT